MNKHAIAALILLGACTEMQDPIVGTQSLKVELVSPASGGTTMQRLLDTQRAITINITALDAEGEVDTTFDRNVQVYVQFLGTLTPKLSEAPLASIRVTAGKATNQTVMLPLALGPTTLWIDDGKDANPTYATGTSPTLWYRDPYIRDLQTPKSETALDALSSIPLEDKQVSVSQSRHGARGRFVVTSVFSQGYTVSDVECADANGTPPCTAQSYDHAMVFSFSAPRGKDHKAIVEGQLIDGFAGGVVEFNGLTEIGFPQTFANGGTDVNKDRLPTPVVADTETTVTPETWFDSLMSPGGGLINFERNESAPIQINNAKVCDTDDDYTTYKQWKLDPSGVGGNCKGNKKIINVITAGTVSEIDPVALKGRTFTRVIGVLRPVNIGTFNVWIIYPRSSADLVLQ
ncbi:MAG: hypothetical protein H0T46_07055 [Deltaproteobacteria bacterium]|nr:hypothetical protein [Deltaproteobacteria bacterium]